MYSINFAQNVLTYFNKNCLISPSFSKYIVHFEIKYTLKQLDPVKRNRKKDGRIDLGLVFLE